MQPSLIRHGLWRLEKEIVGRLFLDQWAIFTGSGMDHRSLDWKRLKPLVPPRDRYWGDPFLIHRDGHAYIFMEEKLYSTGRAHIACLELGTDGSIVGHGTALEQAYHLSYPFLFEHEDGLYMMPESAQNRTLDVYRCVEFPYRWQHQQTLLRDSYIVDATMLKHEGRCWLFASMSNGEKWSTHNALHIFHADSPLAENWTAHPLNPVVKGLDRSRPAGRIFTQDGQLIRPAQNSTRRYGWALGFHQIDRLTTTEYAEHQVAEFTPVGGKIRAVHTYNSDAGTVVVDAVIRRGR